MVLEDVLGDYLLDYYGVRWDLLLDDAGDLNHLLDDAVHVLDLRDYLLHDYEDLGLLGGLLFERLLGR